MKEDGCGGRRVTVSGGCKGTMTWTTIGPTTTLAKGGADGEQKEEASGEIWTEDGSGGRTTTAGGRCEGTTTLA
ncbi:hypothetical protein GUJ93_ZPchr0001g29493 [Zizania palustris]|uniref:Uncharacterized protein n=1 Tax=Zizania palustris TaxID=103762 RepID=A0A8J5RB93_ZIZPA|nr:hypothetical protein GUJ93_ZPchr0001g29493 [Zizania palustris]